MSQSEREPYLDEKEKGKSESMSKESEFHAEGRWIPGKAESLPEEGKDSPGGPGKFRFHAKSS